MLVPYRIVKISHDETAFFLFYYLATLAGRLPDYLPPISRRLQPLRCPRYKPPVDISCAASAPLSITAQVCCT